MKQKQKRKMTLKQKSGFYGYMFIFPWIIGFLLFFVTPIVLSMRFSFNKITPTKASYDMEFMGLQNFIQAFTGDVQFPKLLYDSMFKLFTNVPVILVFSFFVAILFKKNFLGRNIFKGIFFLPIIMSSGLFVLLQTNFGNLVQASNLEATIGNVANNLTFLQSINLSKYLLELGMPDAWISFITGPINTIYTVITNSGIQIFIFLAGLNAIPPSLYEASHIEGASAWETFWEITFPMMVPMILVNVIYSIVDSFTALTNGVMNYTYELAFVKYNFGLSSAMNWVYFLILAAVMGITGLFISRRAFYYT